MIVAIDRTDVADYVSTLTTIYIALIFVAVILSFFPRIPYNRYLSAVIGFVRDVTDPYLNLFRRVLPPVSIGPGALDLSPMVGIIVLILVSRIVVSAIAG